MMNTIKAFAQLAALIFLGFALLLTLGESVENAAAILAFFAVLLPFISRNFRALFLRAYGFAA